MGHIADDSISIAAERRRIRMAEGLGDDNWHTANGSDLDKCAAGYDLYRSNYESDATLRARIQAIVDKNKLYKIML